MWGGMGRQARQEWGPWNVPERGAEGPHLWFCFGVSLLSPKTEQTREQPEKGSDRD